MVTVNDLLNLVHSQKTTQRIHSSLNRMVNTFSFAADEILTHYHDTLLLIHNPTFLIQMLPHEDLVRVKKTINNHAELKSNFNSPAIPLISLLRMSTAELFTDSNEKVLYLLFLIPLFDPTLHKIIKYDNNHVISQPLNDNHLFTSTALWQQTKFTHNHDLLISSRQLIHRRKHKEMNLDIQQSSKSYLIEDILFITKASQKFTINCKNKSTEYEMSAQIALAIYLPYDCSLSSELLTIPTHNYHATVSITQSIHLAHIRTNLNFSTHSDLHKDLTIANLTDFTLFGEAIPPNPCTLTTTEWILIASLAISSSLATLLLVVLISFLKGLFSDR